MTALARFSLAHPRWVLFLLGGVTLLLGAGLPRLNTEVGYRAFLGERHPAIVELDAFVARFGAGLPMAAVWTCGESSACESVFDEASLRMAHGVTSALVSVPGVRRVDSPATTGLLASSRFGLPRARQLAPEGTPAEDIDALAARALTDATWVHQIVSADGRSGAVLVTLESSDGKTSRRVFDALSRVLDEARVAGFEFALVGAPVEFVVAGDELQRHTVRIIPLMLALVAAMLLMLFRSWHPAAISLAVVGIAVLWTFGLLGWLRWPLNSFTSALAPLILVIGVCDAIHVLARLSAEQVTDRGDERILAACREVGPTCALTTLTTAAGFASFAGTELESLARFGLSAAFGVLVALLLSFTLLPIVLKARRGGAPRELRSSLGWERALARLVAWSGTRRRAVLGATALLCVASLWGVAQLVVEASFEDLYGEDSQVVRWTREVALALRQPETLEIELRPPAQTEAGSRVALRTLADLESGLQRIDGLGPTLSVLAPLRALHRLVRAGELDTETSEAQSLLRLLRAEDPGGVALLVDSRTSALRLSTQAEKLPQERLNASLREVHALLAARLPSGWSAVVTGPLAVVQQLVDAVSRAQLQSFALAFSIVLALVAAYLRSLLGAALVLVPTLLPVVLTLGAMGALGIRLDVGTAMVAAVLLGLAVDDALHVVVPFHVRHRAAGSAAVAIEAAVRSRGRALCTTSLALSVGFFALALSPWKSIASFGVVSGVGILGALLADLVVLPALLVAAESVRRRGGRLAGPSSP